MDLENGKTVTLHSRLLVIVFKKKKRSFSNFPTADKAELTDQQMCQDPAAFTDKSANKSINSTFDTSFLLSMHLFKEFREKNSRCHWNPHLEESIKNVHLEGWLSPTTLLLGGRDIYLDTIRAAWCRRVLSSPAGYGILRFGELASDLEMNQVAQTQFTPLPEALCLIISNTNRDDNMAASLDLISVKLKALYKGMHIPSEQIIYETLGSLINERKIYHTGDGYWIVSPESLMLCGNIPIFTAHNGQSTNTDSKDSSSKNDMVSISCQTDPPLRSTESRRHSKNELSSNIDISSPPLPNKLDRNKSRSFREKSNSKSDRKNNLQRSMSVKKQTSHLSEKDVNLKTSNVNQEKDKGEKMSLLSKVFGRKKKIHTNKEPQHEVELVTFSGQFPPPGLHVNDTFSEEGYASLGWPLTRSYLKDYTLSTTAYNERISSWQRGQLNYLHSPFKIEASTQSEYFNSSTNDDDEFNLIGQSYTSEEQCPQKPNHHSVNEKYQFTEINASDGYNNNLHRQSNSDNYTANASGVTTKTDQIHSHYMYMQSQGDNLANCPNRAGSNMAQELKIRYHGRIKQHHRSFSKSRDSGVNCIGLQHDVPNSRAPQITQSISNNEHVVQLHHSEKNSDNRSPKNFEDSGIIASPPTCEQSKDLNPSAVADKIDTSFATDDNSRSYKLTCYPFTSTHSTQITADPLNNDDILLNCDKYPVSERAAKHDQADGCITSSSQSLSSRQTVIERTSDGLNSNSTTPTVPHPQHNQKQHNSLQKPSSHFNDDDYVNRQNFRLTTRKSKVNDTTYNLEVDKTPPGPSSRNKNYQVVGIL